MGTWKLKNNPKKHLERIFQFSNLFSLVQSSFPFIPLILREAALVVGERVEFEMITIFLSLISPISILRSLLASFHPRLRYFATLLIILLPSLLFSLGFASSRCLLNLRFAAVFSPIIHGSEYSQTNGAGDDLHRKKKNYF